MQLLTVHLDEFSDEHKHKRMMKKNTICNAQLALFLAQKKWGLIP